MEKGCNMNRHIDINKNCVLINGAEFYLYSGEFHYFRVPKENWHDILTKMKEAYCNTVCTYVPWNWHESEEGKIDLTGESHPQRDLDGFLELIEDMGLYAIARPGPYICSEWLHGGIPQWLMEKHPEILALNAKGNPPSLRIFYPPITYLHPTYLEYTAKWYDAVCKVIGKHLYTKEGCIINVFVDDEPSYWGSLHDPLMTDYNPVVVGNESRLGLYQKWLINKYGTVEALNRFYGTHYGDFTRVQPPRRMPKHYRELPRFLDWHWFKLHMIDVYVEKLYHMLRERGVDVPISIISPYLIAEAWAKFQEYFKERGVKIVHMTECYPSLLGPSNVNEDAVGHIIRTHEIYKTSIGRMDTPPLNAEMQSAMSYHITPGEMDVLYLLSLAHGLNGMNFYMMVGGENPRGYGLVTGRSYDISAPIGPHGEIRPHYYAIKRLGRFLKTHSKKLLRTETMSDIAVSSYEPYSACSSLGNTIEYGFRDSVRDALSGYSPEWPGYSGLGPGSTLLTLLALSGVSYAVVDLRSASVAELQKHKQLWVFALDFMDEETQRKLTEYVKLGGNLIMLPRVPHLNLKMEPCRILDELFPAKPKNPMPSTEDHRYVPFSAIDAGELRDLLVLDYVDTFDLPEDAKPVAYDSKSGAPCAYCRKVGNGNATLLGFKLSYKWDAHQDHKSFISYLVNLDGVEKHAYASNPEIIVTERAGEGYGFVFVVNPTGLPAKTKITYTDPRNGEKVTIPKITNNMELPNQGGVILLVNMPVPNSKAEVAYTTSEVLEFHGGGNVVSLVLYGPKDTMGETALKLPEKPLKIEIDEETASEDRYRWREEDNTVYITYRHKEDLIRINVRFGQSKDF